jgi:hypothetical protein
LSFTKLKKEKPIIVKPETHNAKQPSIGAEPRQASIVRMKNIIAIIIKAVESLK